MIIAALPAVLAAVLSGLSCRPSARQAPWSATGIGAAGATLSLGILTDAVIAFAFFSGHVPFDAGSSPAYDLYQRSPVKATLVGTLAAISVLVCSLTVSVLAGKAPRATIAACRVLGVSVVGVSAAALIAIRTIGSIAIEMLGPRWSSSTAAPATVAGRLEILVVAAMILSGSSLILSLSLYIMAFRPNSASAQSSRTGMVAVGILALVLTVQTPSLRTSLNGSQEPPNGAATCPRHEVTNTEPPLSGQNRVVSPG